MLNLCVYLICTRLPRDIQLKLELFLRKSILTWKNINSQDGLKGLDSPKFLEILHSNKTDGCQTYMDREGGKILTYDLYRSYGS